MQTKDKDGKIQHTYRTGKLTLLELMAVLAVLGILLSWVLQQFFLS